jgi:hypothetical protein
MSRGTRFDLKASLPDGEKESREFFIGPNLKINLLFPLGSSPILPLPGVFSSVPEISLTSQ